jgi:hypothetical protein
MVGEMVGIQLQTRTIHKAGCLNLVEGVALGGEKMVAGMDDCPHRTMRVCNRTLRMLLKQPRGKNE